MNIKNIIHASKQPTVYTPGTTSMWTDKYISKQLLQVHLDQNIELASRNDKTISTTTDWILSNVTGEKLNILDLGCGPGLYTTKLAQKGHTVTGVDFSTNSINYALESARKTNLNITYIEKDYLTLSDENKYDLIVMIFTDFGVLTPTQRKTLLSTIRRALKPGGTFLFDVLNENASVKTSENHGWEMAEQGFWRPIPYLALSQSFYYENEDVSLNQHIVIDDTGESEIYRFWIHTFSTKSLTAKLLAGGFSDVQCHHQIIPDSPLCASDNVTFCTCRK